MERKDEEPARRASNQPGTGLWRPIFQYKTPLEGSGSLYRFNTVDHGYRFLDFPNRQMESRDFHRPAFSYSLGIGRTRGSPVRPPCRCRPLRRPWSSRAPSKAAPPADRSMKAVCDTCSLIRLRKGGVVDCLGDLFDRVLLPKAVRDECRAPGTASVLARGFFEVRDVDKVLLIGGLGRGEREAISLADAMRSQEEGIEDEVYDGTLGRRHEPTSLTWKGSPLSPTCPATSACWPVPSTDA